MKGVQLGSLGRRRSLRPDSISERLALRRLQPRQARTQFCQVERFAFDEFHDEVVKFWIVLHHVNRNDVRMIEVGEDLGLLQELLDRGAIIHWNEP